MSAAKKKVSAFAVVEIIFIVILALIMVTMLAFNLLFKDSSAKSVFGYSFYNTKAVNMLPDFPKNTVVIAKKSEIANIKENSVILCNIGEHTTLIRVVQLLEEEGQKYYVVKFDTSPANETFKIGSDAVIAKAVWQIDGMGAFLDFATSTVGIIIAVIIPLMFIIAIQVARILSIRKLENEAASIDDIDELINTRYEEKPAPVTFTEPKFVEDVTGKIPVVKQYGVSREEESKPEKILNVDNCGRAEYTEKAPENQDNSPLFTYDRLSGGSAAAHKEPAMSASNRGVSRDELYMNRPTRINPEKSSVDEFFEKYAPKDSTAEDMFTTEKSEPVVFTPHLSNVIPESIAAVQEEASAPRKSSFDESVKAYFEKPSAEIAEEIAVPDEPAAIPENAVRPKETLAPPKKKKNNKTLSELMSIIDAEESKLKK